MSGLRLHLCYVMWLLIMLCTGSSRLLRDWRVVEAPLIVSSAESGSAERVSKPRSFWYSGSLVPKI